MDDDKYKNSNNSMVPDEFMGYLANSASLGGNFERIRLRNSFFDYVMNVPADGWCLLYAFQIGYFSQTDNYIALNTIRTNLIENFKEFCQNPLTKDFLNFKNEEDDLDNMDISKLIFISKNPLQTNIKLNIFNLLNYLIRKIFNSDIVDLIPRLLANLFLCIINIYHISKDNCFVLQKHNIIYPISVDGSSLHHNLPKVNLLYVTNYNHYMVLTDRKISSQFLNRIITDIKSIDDSLFLEDLSKKDFFLKVAINFKSNSKIISSKSSIHKINPANLSGELTNCIDCIFSKPVTTFTNDMIKTIEIAIKSSNHSVFLNNFNQRFRNFEEFYDFVRNFQIGDLENIYIYSIIDSLVNDLVLESNKNKSNTKQYNTDYNNNIVDSNNNASFNFGNKRKKIVKSFMYKILKLCSTRGIYAELNLIWILSNDQIYSMRVLPKCLFIDETLNKVFTLIKWNTDLDNYQIRLADDQEIHKLFSAINTEDKIFDIVNIVASDLPHKNMMIQSSKSNTCKKKSSSFCSSKTIKPVRKSISFISPTNSNEKQELNLKKLHKQTSIEKLKTKLSPNIKSISYTTKNQELDNSNKLTKSNSSSLVIDKRRPYQITRSFNMHSIKDDKSIHTEDENDREDNNTYRTKLCRFCGLSILVCISICLFFYILST